MRTLFAVLSLALSGVAVAGAQGAVALPALVVAQTPVTPPPAAQGRPAAAGAQTPVPQPPVVMGTQQTPAGGVPTLRPNVPVPTAPAAAQGPRPEVQPVPSVAANIRLDLTITDTLTGAPVTKALTMHIMSGARGSIRSVGSGGTGGQLDVDASVRVFQNTMVTTTLTFSYSAVAPPSATPAGRPASLQESITVLLQDGKSLVVSQSADPASDRKVTVELKATIVPIAR